MAVTVISQCSGGEHLVIDVDGERRSITRTELFKAYPDDAPYLLKEMSLSVEGLKKDASFQDVKAAIEGKADVRGSK